MIASWPERAACLRAEPRLFDPPVVGEFHFARARVRKSNPRARMDQALSFCKVCPVVNECLADAVKNRESGIRGGQLVTDGRIMRLPVPTPQPQRPLKPVRDERRMDQTPPRRRRTLRPLHAGAPHRPATTRPRPAPLPGRRMIRHWWRRLTHRHAHRDQAMRRHPAGKRIGRP